MSPMWPWRASSSSTSASRKPAAPSLGRLRLNFSHVAPERLHEGLRRLAKVVRDAQAAEAA